MSNTPIQSNPRSLWRQLFAWALGGMLVLWLLVAVVAYYTGLAEADEISDGTLVSAAQLVLNQPRVTENISPSIERQSTPLNEYAPDLHVLIWQDDSLVWDSHGSLGKLPQRMELGHQSLLLNLEGRNQEWRVYVAQAPDSQGGIRRVAVFLDPERRLAFATDVTEDIVIPTLMFLPLMALVLAWAIRRGLLPLKHISADILALNVDAGQALHPKQAYSELDITVHAINTLVQRLQDQLARERKFTADVAHELRTPLTSLVLQARLAQDKAGHAEQARVLKTVEYDALRAGRILSQLLDLARAQDAAGQFPEPVDIVDLAKRVVSDHASLAYDLGQKIALKVPGRQLIVQGSTTLIELALRNLIDNALRHNPRGTDTEVQLKINEAGQPVLAVSDNGKKLGSTSASRENSAHPDAISTPHLDLGIGLTLVERIAQSQGARFVHDDGVAPFLKRYMLVWGV